MYQAELKILEFIDLLASKEPAPGGGAAAALAGALGSALACMVCSLTRGKEAYAAHQELAAQAQDKAKELEVSASAGGGMVKVVASGDMQLKSIAIDPEALDPDDVELLQDMILAAVNDALNSASEAANSEVASATGLGGMDLGGMGIPGLF